MAKKIIGTKWQETATTRKHWRIPMSMKSFTEAAGPAGGADPEPGTGADPEPGAGNGGTDPAGGGEGGAVTLESLMAEVAAVKAENAKLKNANDKLSSESGTLRKQLRAKMTAEEEAAAQKAEEEEKRKEYVTGLEKKLAIIESTAQYINLGFDPETAAATAQADYDGDKDTVNANFKKVMADREKKMEATLREKLLKEIPAPQSGNQGNVDYSKQINDAINSGDMRAAALAILTQAQSQGN